MLDRKIVVSATGALVLGLASLAWFGAAQAAGYPKYSGDEGNRTAVAEIYNPFDNLAILAFGENAGPTPITAIEIEVPAEVSIESVLSEENPGTWDAASGTFVFAQPVVPGTTLLVEITLNSLASGLTTEVEWTAVY